MRKFLSSLGSLGRKIAGFVMLALGLSVTALIVINIIADFPLWVLGKNVTGVVEQKWYELDEENKGELTFTYYVEYSFTTPEGEKIEGSSRLSALEWSALVEGGDVRVVYSPFDRTNSRIDDSRFRPLLVCTYVPFIFISWFFLAQAWEILSSEFIRDKSDLWRLEEKEG